MTKKILIAFIISKSLIYADNIKETAKYYLECTFEQKNWDYKIKMCKKSIEPIEKKWFKSEQEKQTLYNGYWNMGLAYHMKQNYSKAIEFYEKTIKNDCCKYTFQISALNNLGVIYKSDNKYTNKIKAYQYYKRAAKYGNKNAQNNLDYLCKHSPWACK